MNDTPPPDRPEPAAAPRTETPPSDQPPADAKVSASPATSPRPPCVVLVRTQFAGNLGSVARAMANFGLDDLRLVAPIADTADREARVRSTRGEVLLDSARRFDTLAAAVADSVAVVGTSSNPAGQYRGQRIATPAEAMTELCGLAASGPIALVFGPEDHGLSNAEVALCTRLLTLPAAAEYPVMNLSQAVMLCLYEWHCTSTGLRDREAVGGPAPEVAASAHRERMFDRLEDALTRVGFLDRNNPKHLMFAVRNLLNRARPSPVEADILLGLARQIRWYVDHHPRKAGD